MQNIDMAIKNALNEENPYFKIIWYIVAAVMFFITVFVKVFPLLKSSKRTSIYSERLKIISFPLIAMISISIAFGVLQNSIFDFIHLFNLKGLSILYAYVLSIMFLVLMFLYLIIGLTNPDKKNVIYSDYTKGSNINYELLKEQRKLEKLTIDKFLTSHYPNKCLNPLLKRFSTSRNNIKDYKFLRATKIHLFIHRFIIVLGSYYVGILGYFLFKLPFIIESLAIVAFIIILLIAIINTLYILNISMKNYDHLKHYREENEDDDKEG
ncbi:hypothetical protein WER83_02545 [Staphylococcus felis]|uniref:hypothetical protein n=1 Tax=Staphylococcus felis TaxID=46127 RepID=UPI003967D7A8